ncbi:MAG: SBBP repeat-containing protein [Candidatus Aminicenantes bacterium]|nr:SBBP repeat-containing protein [Candidatus Aminicenantes bacterium]
MKKRIFFTVIFVIVLCGVCFLGSAPPDRNPAFTQGISAGRSDLSSRAATAVKADLDFAKFPLYFIANQGQVNEKARFYAKASGYTLWLTKEGLIFDSTAPAPSRQHGHNSKIAKENKSKNGKPLTPPHVVGRDVSRLMFVGADKNPEIVPIKPAKLKVNYFKGRDRSKWHGGIPTSQAVLYKNIYENIDLKVYGIEKQIEYDWIVKAGGNPENIEFVYKNVQGAHLDDKGNLIIETAFGELKHKKPVSFQEIKAERQEDKKGESRESGKAKREMVNVTFKKTGKNTYGFSVGDYDKNRDLIIDPVVLVYSTYLGGSHNGCVYGLKVNVNGYIYVTGTTSSPDFPITGQFQANQADYDAFITKFDPGQSGSDSLLYSTYVGGSRFDHGRGIAVDQERFVCVTGITRSANFPTLNQFHGYNGDSDAFVVKLDTIRSGAAGLVYSTYLGGSGYDEGYEIAVDGSSYIYVTGRTNSANFAALNQYQEHQGDYDAFLTKLDPSRSGNSALIYSTYLGGGMEDYGFGLDVGQDGCAYVAGSTHSSNFPTKNPYQTFLSGSDAFAAKIDTGKSGAASLIYSTCLGGTMSDVGNAVALDVNGYMYVTGTTSSENFPTKNQYQQYVGSGGANDNGFLAKLNPDKIGSGSLLYSTYLGGSEDEEAMGIAVDSNHSAYVTGYTWSSDFPTKNQYQSNQGSKDVFITKINTSRSGAAGLVFSTYLGGGSDDHALAIDIDGIGNMYVGGGTYSANFPILGQYQGDQGLADAFVTKLFYPVAPTVSTEYVYNISAASATVGGYVMEDGGSQVTARGVCWGVSFNPAKAGAHKNAGLGTGPFSVSVTGLKMDTTYYARAYAVNSTGTAYGKNLQFKTLKNPSISGAVTGAGGAGLPGVSLLFSNNGGTALTDQQGVYSRPVNNNWSGSVTPAKTGYVFSPASRTYNGVTSDRGDQDYTGFIFVPDLQVFRGTESGWLISKQFGKIELDIENPHNIAVAKYVIYRKEAGQEYVQLEDIPGSQLESGAYVYYDKYLDKDKSYTYKFTVVDSSGVTIAESAEKTITGGDGGGQVGVFNLKECLASHRIGNPL